MAKIDKGAGERLPLNDKPQVRGEGGEDDESETETETETETEVNGGEPAAAASGIAPGANGAASDGEEAVAGEPAPNVARPRFGQRPVTAH